MARPRQRKTPKAAKQMASRERARRTAQPTRTRPATRYTPIGRPAGDAGNEVGRGTPPPEGQGGPPGGSPPPSDNNQFNWMGLPPDVAAKVAEMIRGGSDDDVIMGYIRTTPWYANEYAGIQQFMQNGKIQDTQNPEREYQRMKGNIRQTYKRFYGRDVMPIDMEAIARQGYDDKDVDQIGQGYSNAKAMGGQWDYYSGAFGGGVLTDVEKQQYGQQLAGFQTDMGLSIQQKVQQAMDKAQKVFQGVQGTNINLEQSLGDTVKRRQQTDIGA